MQILGLIGMYFDAVVSSSICHQPFTFIQIGSGHTVLPFLLNLEYIVAVWFDAVIKMMKFLITYSCFFNQSLRLRHRIWLAF